LTWAHSEALPRPGWLPSYAALQRQPAGLPLHPVGAVDIAKVAFPHHRRVGDVERATVEANARIGWRCSHDTTNECDVCWSSRCLVADDRRADVQPTITVRPRRHRHDIPITLGHTIQRAVGRGGPCKSERCEAADCVVDACRRTGNDDESDRCCCERRQLPLCRPERSEGPAFKRISRAGPSVAALLSGRQLSVVPSVARDLLFRPARESL